MEQQGQNGRRIRSKHDRFHGFNGPMITEDYDEVFEVTTSPDINPLTFRQRVQCLMISGMTQTEAEQHAITTPIQLSLFYDIGRGAFAIATDAVEETPLYNPYTGEEIPEETASEESQGVSYTLSNGESIELLSEMHTANYDFGDFDETIEDLINTYREASDRETKESLEHRIDAQCDAFADFLGIQYEEIQETPFSNLSSSIKQALLGNRT